MKTTASSTKSAAGMDAMKRKHKDLQDRANGKGGGGDGKYDKIEEGKNYRRFLPIKGSDKFFVDQDMHFRIGPAAKTIVCIGAKCPVCKRFEKEKRDINAKYSRGDEKGKRLYKKIASELMKKNRSFSFVYDPKKGDNKVMVLGYGEQIMRPLLDSYFDVDECGDFTKRKTGRDVIISRVGTDRSTEYTTRASTKKRVIPLEEWKALIEQTEDEEGLLKIAGEKLEAEQIKAIMDGVDEDEESVDEDEDEDADEDEESEESEEEEDEEAEDDEDEEPPAKKSTKDKLKAKASRR